MKLITFAIPCYNSANYMKKCIDSLLDIIENIEIIIINDGSEDDTLKIAINYAKKYPNTIRVVDKENGGHGSGVNVGLKLAKGLYYKVIDSDDWVDKKALNDVINQIKNFNEKNEFVDLLIANYVYEKKGTTKIIRYKNLPTNKVFTWEDIKRFKIDKYLMMHSVFYNTDFLKKINLVLPEKTFYVDNIFVYYPLAYVQTMYYLNTNFYHYTIGRVDQSINEQNMIKRIDQQIKVTKIMLNQSTDIFKYRKEKHNLFRYQVHCLAIMLCISNTMLKISGSFENKKKIKELWRYLKYNNFKLYKFLRFKSIATLTCFPRFIVLIMYLVTRKIFKYN